MSYCSLKEAYGEDFQNQVNFSLNKNNDHKKMNPTRNSMFLSGSRNGSEISRVGNIENARQIAEAQSSNDILAHKRSFSSVSGRRYEEPPLIKNETTIRAWGETENHLDDSNNLEHGYPLVSDISPKEHLKKSLLRDRPYKEQHYNKDEYYRGVYEPSGNLETLARYKNLEQSKCNDYFYHLDTCKKCQNKLKKRVVRYLKALQNNKRMNLLPGSSGVNSHLLIEKELFRDDDDEHNDVNETKPLSNKKHIPKENLIENFSNPTNNKALYLLLFGIFVIYTLDNSNKMLK